MKYQLVLQLPASSPTDFDDMTQLEETIIQGLGALGDVDGHDVGSGEMNIFVLTDEPELAFKRIKALHGAAEFMPNLRVAYRELGASGFIIMHPADLDHFAIA